MPDGRQGTAASAVTETATHAQIKPPLIINLDTTASAVPVITMLLVPLSLPFAARWVDLSSSSALLFTLAVGILGICGITWWSRTTMSPKLDWSKEIVVITGGGSGVGALLATRLAQSPLKRGVKVVVLTLLPPIYDEKINGLYTYRCDVSNYEEVQAVAAQIRVDVGEPTVLVNNAGIVKGKLLLDLSPEDIAETFNVNTLAHYWTLKAFLPGMLERRHGHIVNISSVLGLCGAAQMTDYCASKAALVSLHASLRAELDFRYLTPEIRTSLVLPGHILTSMFHQLELPSNTLFRFIAPPVAPEVVVGRIVRAIESSSSSMIRLPFYTHSARVLADGVGLAPDGLKSWAGWFTGAHVAMRNYEPHPDAGERLAQTRE